MYGTFLWDQNHDLATNDGSYFMQSPDYVCDANRYNLRGISLGYTGPENGSVAFNTRDTRGYSMLFGYPGNVFCNKCTGRELHS